jgi:hypothetical protein
MYESCLSRDSTHSVQHLRACSVKFGVQSEIETSTLGTEIQSDAHAPPPKPRKSLHQTYENTYNLLTTKAPQDPIYISSCVYGSHWIADAGLVDCLWMPLISVLFPSLLFSLLTVC